MFGRRHPRFRLSPPGTKDGQGLVKPIDTRRLGRARSVRDLNHRMGINLSLFMTMHEGSGGKGRALESTIERRKRRNVAPAPSLKDDASFLASLLSDNNFSGNDMKDVIGEGINFIKERANERQQEREQNLRESLPGGMGGFLEEYSLASDEGLSAVLEGGGGGRRQRRRRKKSKRRARSTELPHNETDEEGRPGSLPAIHSAVEAFQDAGKRSVGKKRAYRGEVRTKDKLPPLAITMRLDAMKVRAQSLCIQPVLLLCFSLTRSRWRVQIESGTKPRRRRVNRLKSFEEMAGEQKVKAVQVAHDMAPSPLVRKAPLAVTCS